MLDLPAKWGLYKKFAAEKLRKAADNPLLKQRNEPEPPIEIAGDLE